MKAGRPPEHPFNSLKLGETAQLKGSAKKYPYQFINQYQKKDKRKLKLIRDGNKVFVERIA